MPLPFVIPQNAQPPLDPRTGSFNRPWYLFFQAIFERIGGVSGTGNVVLDGMIADLQTQVATQTDLTAELAQFKSTQTTRDASQDATVAALTLRVTDLEVLGAFA